MRLPLILVIATGLCLGGVTGAGAQPSFDCAKAGNATELAICESSGLSKLDRHLAAAYGSARADASKKKRKALLADQKAWINRRNACGANAACIDQQMRQRIAQLQAAGARATASSNDGLSGQYCSRGGADLLLVEKRGGTLDFSIASFQSDGHSCATGRLRAKKAGSSYTVTSDGCTFRITARGGSIVFTAGPFERCRTFCGAKAGFGEHVFAISGRHKLPSGWSTAMESGTCG